jgi:hypothetical protein
MAVFNQDVNSYNGLKIIDASDAACLKSSYQQKLLPAIVKIVPQLATVKMMEQTTPVNR